MLLQLSSLKLETDEETQRILTIISKKNSEGNIDLANIDFYCIFSTETCKNLHNYLLELETSTFDIDMVILLLKLCNKFYDLHIYTKIQHIFKYGSIDVYHCIREISKDHFDFLTSLMQSHFIDVILSLPDCNFDKNVLFLLQFMQTININIINSLDRNFKSIENRYKSKPDEDILLKLFTVLPGDCKFENLCLESPIIWSIILKNIASTESFNRKRAMYLFDKLKNHFEINSKRQLNILLGDNEVLSIDFSHESAKNVALLIDSLEEKQTHIILPIIKRFDKVLQDFQSNHLSFHWISALLKRASFHESTVIVKWAFTNFLMCPISLNCVVYRSFLLNNFPKLINSSNIYFSVDSLNEENGFFARSDLSLFLTNLLNRLETPDKEWIVEFFNKLSSFTWNFQGLLYFSEIFNELNLEIDLPIDLLDFVLTLYRINVNTLDIKFRQCILSFLLIGFLNNHKLKDQYLMTYINVLMLDIDFSSTILYDHVLLRFLCDTKLQELTYNPEIWSKLKDLSLSNIDLEKYENCVLAHVFFLLNLIDTNDLSIILSEIVDQIKSYGPYSDAEKLIKTVITLKCFDNVSCKIDKTDLRVTVTESIRGCLRDTLKFLTTQMADKSNMIPSIALLKYFIENYPDVVKDSYQINKNSILRILLTNSVNFNDKEEVDLNFLFKGHFDLNDAWNCEILMYTANLIKLNKILFSDTEIIYLYEFVLDFCELTNSSNLTLVFQFFGSLLEVIIDRNDLDIHELLLSVLKTCWSLVKEEVKSGHKFWLVYETFIKEVLMRYFRLILSTKQEVSILINQFQQILDDMFRIAEMKFGVINLLSQYLTLYFTSDNQQYLHQPGSIVNWLFKLLCKLSIFGCGYHKRRTMKYDCKTERFITGKYGKSRWFNSYYNKLYESSERLWGILLICHKSFSVYERMIEEYQELEADLIKNTKVSKNYSNNQMHRFRNRVYINMLICVKLSFDNPTTSSLSESCVDTLFERMVGIVQKETLTSIRHFAEWILLIILNNNHGYIHKLLDLLKGVSDSKPAYVCSLILLFKHTLTFIDFNDERIVEKLFFIVLPLCSAQNYNIRLYSVCFLMKLKTHTENSMILTSLNNFEKFLERSITNRNIQKLSENFWWFKFDFQSDFNLEMLLHVVPMYFGLLPDELILKEQFKDCSDKFDVRDYKIEFEGDADKIQYVMEHTNEWRIKTDTEFNDTEQDIQKKVQPWLTIRPDEIELRELYDVGRREESELILVCSLLDKFTNIGGLVRSGNIFGVKEVVVNNLCILDQLEFKQLSVTAEKWIRTTEVPVRELEVYFQEKKAEGFEIIGIEQTADSVGLEQAKFIKKTVFLLGNERKGIPTYLLSHLDRCIEIPQYGQIRSLNVHVTGAIFLWEYMKQTRLCQKNNSEQLQNGSEII